MDGNANGQNPQRGVLRYRRCKKTDRKTISTGYLIIQAALFGFLYVQTKESAYRVLVKSMVYMNYLVALILQGFQMSKLSENIHSYSRGFVGIPN